MHPQYQRLEEQIRQAIAAHRRDLLFRGLSLFLLSLLGGFGLLLLLARLDASFLILRWLAAGISLSMAAFVLVQHLLRPWRRTPTPQQVARRIEEQHPDLEDRLVTAVEFGEQTGAPQMQIMLRRLLNEVTLQTANVNFARHVTARYAGVWKLFLSAAVALLAITVIGFLQPIREDLRHLFASSASILSGSLTVTPGDVSVRRGSTVKIEAQTAESSLDKAALYVSTGDTSWSSHDMLFAEPGRFAYELFDLQDTVRYYVRAGDDLSPIYRISPLDAPALRSIRLTYRYPASLGLPPKSTNYSGDIYGPAGTTVDITATFSAALATASLQIGDNAPQPAHVEKDTVLIASLEIKEDGYYRLLVSGANGMEGEAQEYFIRLLPDEPPEITLRRPGRDARVTMIEEVMVEASVAEDFDLKKFDLVYTINDGTPQRVSMLPRARRGKSVEDDAVQRLEYVAANLFYLEDLKVVPGDFISYYIETADRNENRSSDIYFIEVRPFEEEFHMAPSQGGSSGSMPASLSISEKEIIIATWKLERERGKMAEKEFEEKARAIAEAQRGVRDTIEQLRMMLSAQGEGGAMGGYFDRAIEAMKRAEGELDAIRVGEALSPEREAYNYLLKADAEIRRRDLQRGQANAGTRAESQEELQRLFADELGKMQSKYETLQNNQRRFEEKEISDALEKVRQLAQRQEQLNDMNRQLARQQTAEEERRRQIARLRREQEALARETDELERRLQNLGRQSDQSSSTRSSIAENLRQATEEMSRAGNSLSRDNPENAAADGRRAVDRLERLEQQLRRSASQSMQQRLADLQQDFRDLAEAQRRLADSLAQRGAGVSDEQRRQWELNQRRLGERAGELAQRLLESGRNSRANQRPVQEAIDDALESWRKSEVKNRMQQAEDALRSNRLDESERQQRQALRGIRSVEDELAQAQSLLAQNNEEKLDVALQQAQNLRRDLEQQIQEQGNPSAGLSRDTAHPSREETVANQQQGDAASRRSPSQQALKPEEMKWWQERMWRATDQLNRLRPMVSGDSALAESYSAMQRELNGYVRSFAGGDPQRLTDIENRLIDPLRRFEAELATKLALAQQRQRLASAQDEQVPPAYREMVERYYEALARSKAKVRSKKE